MTEIIPFRAKLFVVTTAAAGVAVLGMVLAHWHSQDNLKFGCYLLIAIVGSTMKVRFPKMDSTMSVHFLFVLMGILDLSLAETLVIGCSAALVQSVWKTKQRPDPLKVAFNVLGMSANAIWLTYAAYHFSSGYLTTSMPLLLLVAACVYFLSNTVPVSIVIALSEKISLRKVWVETYFWSFPYYLVGAAVVGFVSFSSRSLGWQNALMTLPVMYAIYRSYVLYLGHLEGEQKRVEIEERQLEVEKLHVEEVCALHLRTIEAMALAIDAKDHTTHQHLHRVRTYAVEMARDLNLSQKETDALRAAALLHDIGKLAVPDHIINKPGRLSPEEFEKMKIHPIVGADILEKVAFPYPVAPIVRSHHEKWDGTGYPEGLAGAAIPIGARILAAVDCLDALASDRQYRKALPLDEAMRMVAHESGKAFDPKVVEILQRRYRELESYAVRSLEQSGNDSTNLQYKVEGGQSPDAGFERDLDSRRSSPSDFLSSIASARHEAHTLFELTQNMGKSLSLDETLSLFAMRIRRVVPYDSIVVFIRRGDTLVPEYVAGDNFRQLSSLSIPVGKGLSGWVAENSRAIVNGDPAVEPGFVRDPKRSTELRSALAVPLEGLSDQVGVMALYQADADAFTSDHLRLLQVVTSKVALYVENALKFGQAEDSATIDYLTGLPNARGLSLYLERDLARCERENSMAAVMVCDLNGFKQVNDRFGHVAGDRVLKVFSKLAQAECGDYDYMARMGGDEFVIVSTAMTPGAARERAVQLSALAQEAAYKVCGEDMISLSFGAAFYPRDGVGTAQLLAEAERKMYADKRHHYEVRKGKLALISQQTVA